MRFAEVVVVLLDVGNAFEEQDQRIADLVEQEGRAIVIAVNKWDLKEKTAGAIGKLREQADEKLMQMKGVPLVAVSAPHRRGPRPADAGDRRCLRSLEQARADQRRSIAGSSTPIEAHPPPAVSGRRLRLNYITQAKARPPSFVVFCTRADAVPDAYKRYLVNSLRESFRTARHADPPDAARERQPVQRAGETQALSRAGFTTASGIPSICLAENRTICRFRCSSAGTAARSLQRRLPASAASPDRCRETPSPSCACASAPD